MISEHIKIKYMPLTQAWNIQSIFIVIWTSAHTQRKENAFLGLLQIVKMYNPWRWDPKVNQGLKKALKPRRPMTGVVGYPVSE